MENTKVKIPKWFWIIAIFFLLWNIVGVLSFFAHTFISEEALANLPENERALYSEYPMWITVVFAIAVFSGLSGAIGLILRKKWAKKVFMISILAIVLQMFHNIFLTKSIEVYGLLQAITMPVLVIIFGLFLIWFSDYGIKKNWLV